MATLIKTFLRGLLYLFVLPGLLIVLAFTSVISIFVFLYIGIKGAILWFTGRNIFGDLPEDVMAKHILYPEDFEDKNKLLEKAKPVEEKEPENSSSIYTAQFYMPQTDYRTDNNLNKPESNSNDGNQSGGDNNV